MRGASRQPNLAERGEVDMRVRRSDSRTQARRAAAAVTTGALAIAVFAAPARAEDADVARAPGQPVVIGQEYQAGGVHRWLWGDDYRSLWTTPTRVGSLDLHTFAGGLSPVARVGGRETKALALRGADG